MSQISYYVTGNTAEGFINYLQSNLKGVRQIFVLKHESNKIKTIVLRYLLKMFEEENEVEVLLSTLGEKYLDGLIVRNQSLAVISDFIHDPELESVNVIDLTPFIGELPSDKKIVTLKDKVKDHIQQSYDNFAQGLKIHDDLESIYINEMDFEKADKITNEFIEELFKNIPTKENESIIYKRLFGTNTPEGAVNVVPDILSSMQHAYFIKGRAGTGKSTFMKKVLSACKKHGFDIEIYHCSFDPQSIDMVLVRELSFCIFDSTNPHEFFPKQAGHKKIDMYEETVTPGTDEKYADEIIEVTARYKSYMKKGIEKLKEADAYLDQVEKRYEFNPKEQGDRLKEIYDKIV
ncbi:MAG TPA: hypothetical protein VK072_04475 [Candidatus Avamphibacillus sp.]|nr:hypothetical protein [Candidatus Avamphibacillus sp.]